MSTADTYVFGGASLNQKPIKPWYTLKCQFPTDARRSKVTNLFSALCLKPLIVGTYAHGQPDTAFKTRDKHFLFHLRVRGVTHHFYIFTLDGKRLVPSSGRLYARWTLTGGHTSLNIGLHFAVKPKVPVLLPRARETALAFYKLFPN
jgi:hypothetical protein